MNNFTIETYTNNSKVAKVSDNCLISLWSNLCEKHCGKLSVNAIRALLCVDMRSDVKHLSSSTVNEMTDPFYFCNDGAALYPDDYPSWESEDLSLCHREKDGSLTTSFHGEVMKGKIIAAIINLHADFCAKNQINPALVGWSA
jgi:hypothetical protein